MIVLSVAVHPADTGGTAIEPYLSWLAGLGVGAIEAQLSADMRDDEIAQWGATLSAAAKLGLAVGFHAPMPPRHPSWPAVLGWARDASPSPAAIVAHACAGPRPAPELAERSVEHLRRLADAAPDVLIGLENSANTAAGPLALLRAWNARRRRAALAGSRPRGVGSGMGVPQPAVAPVAADDPVDAPRRARPRSARWSAAGSRDAALAICDGVNRANCMLAWDLAHDWIAARHLRAPQTTVPPADMLRRVGYVRVHDVDDSGTDHCLLVMGNVPYATQLRALMSAGFSGTVCLAARYTAAMRIYGGRRQAFERSLHVLKQTLKLG